MGTTRFKWRLASPVLVSAGTSGAKASSTERLAESFITSETPLLDLFHRDVLQLLLQQPTAGERLCRFAQTRGGRVNADFLLKIEEYCGKLDELTSVLNNAVGTFVASSTATTPLALPHELSNNIMVHSKLFARSMLPLLESLFRDARLVVEDRIFHGIYPEFVKHQVALCMKDTLIKEAIASGRDTSELILNYRKDGTAFWNFLFISPLVSQGKLRYFLGAQINVSEGMGTCYADILRILNFEPPAGEPPETKAADSADGNCKRMAADPRRRSERRFFKTFSRRSNPPSLSVTLPEAASEDRGSPLPSASPTSAPLPLTPGDPFAPAMDRVPEDVHTPYSVYFVMRYVPPADRPPGLPVTFCSAQALELLCLGPRSVDALAGLDMFAVLADLAASPTVSRTFKAAVHDRLQAGEPITTDLLINADPQAATARRAKRSGVLGLAPWNKDAAETSPTGGADALAERLILAEALASPSLMSGDRGADLVPSVSLGSRLRKMAFPDEDGGILYVRYSSAIWDPPSAS
ncbi:hypothetical protein P8C59_000424 [Phyllachora maydis]|uniref:Uncharacterized protein n=1 Tax=Phyllachora maydis TaxID=1825666 RepID=A0AAD9HXM4_9PEZI|nr:hypothetical protein P8C59_000424 [Phyllachora maydis]